MALLANGEVTHVLIVIGLAGVIAGVIRVGDRLAPVPVSAVGVSAVGSIAHLGQEHVGYIV